MSDTTRLGIIGGSAFLDGLPLDENEPIVVETAHGSVTAHVGKGFVFLRRHGTAGYRPPHRIPHHAHVLALESLGVTRVAGLASTGALRATLLPGSIVVPHDYMSWHPPPTFAEDEYLHIVPALDTLVRQLLLAAAEEAARVLAERAGAAPAVLDAGVYVQTHGPRFETAAEVRVLAQYADVVGMTAASEATLCQERGIGYAMLCIVDNFAHGVGATPLTLDSFRAQLARNAALADAIVRHLVATTPGGPVATPRDG